MNARATARTNTIQVNPRVDAGANAAVRTVWTLAVSDFRDRRRRPAYLACLAVAVGLGYLAVPEADGHWTILDVAGYRGVYTSAYVGAATALAAALWLTVGGFYVVRDAVARDERTGVGVLLAATPLRSSAYFLAKFGSNVLVLWSMAGVVAATAVVMQLVRGESRAVNPWAIIEPCLVVTLPALTMTASLALVFDTVPILRRGLGNIVWLPVAGTLALAGGPVDPTGVRLLSDSFRAALEKAGIDAPADGVSLGFTRVDDPLTPIPWPGLDIGAGYLASRALLVAAAVVIALACSIRFARFDDARRPAVRQQTGSQWTGGQRRGGQRRGGQRRGGHGGKPPAPRARIPARTAAHAAAHAAVGSGMGTGMDTGMERGMETGIAIMEPVAGPAVRPAVSPAPYQRLADRGGWGAFPRLLAGEWRLLVRGLSPWWRFAAGCLTVAGAVVTADARATVLLACWAWPVLGWSRLGCRHVEYGVGTLLASVPRRRRRLLAQWSAGVLLAGVTGCGPALRMLADADRAGLAAWAGGTVFVPALALALGTVTGSPRPFQVLYAGLVYLIANGVASADVMGAVRDDGRLSGPPPAVVAAVAAALVAVAVAVDQARDRGRRARWRLSRRGSRPA